MADLVVIAYDDPFKAEEMRTQLRKLQREYLIDLEHIVLTFGYQVDVTQNPV